MAETVIVLLAAHLAGEYLLPPNWAVGRAPKVLTNLAHALGVMVLATLLLGAANPMLMVLYVALHFAIDSFRVGLGKEAQPTGRAGVVRFVAAQLVGLTGVVGLGLAFGNAADSGVWATWLSPPAFELALRILLILSGLLLCVPAGGELIGRLTAGWSAQLEADAEARARSGGEGPPIRGLPGAGRYIGWLERAITFLLILVGQPATIGFLFAAKSILRFGEVRDASQRELAEYVIIGTFMSFGWALLTGFLTIEALRALT
jgi:hypothetical protein